jgi:ABC-type bacteriocin/lantibiotic exporter with double-glycine peptidase domain
VKQSRRGRRRLLAPEVVQSSAMDCGPAALKCMLQGFGTPISYDRLREACQTGLDGTSIDTLESIATRLGFDAEQVMLPLDFLPLTEARAFPSILVVANPLGVTHFVVAWRRHGSWVQVMDPAAGRRWVPLDRLLAETYLHAMPVPASAWRAWAGSPEALAILDARCRELGMPRQETRCLIEEAKADPGWHPLAALDAAVRLAGSLVRARALRRGREAWAFTQTVGEQAKDMRADGDEAIPDAFWSVAPLPSAPDQLLLRGAVLVRVRSRQAAMVAEPAGADLPAELQEALARPSSHPGRELLRLLREDGQLRPAALLAATAVASGAVVLEALFYRGALDAVPYLAPTEQRAGAAIAFLGFLLLVLLLELGITGRFLGLGRGLEVRLRLRFLTKLARLGDRYFRSRLRSDMAERCHSVHRLRLAPELAGNALRFLFQIAATAAGLIWLDPGVAPLVLLAAGFALVLPVAAQPFLLERDLRMRDHAGALGRFYLDSLLGLVPARHHGAELPLRREHEALLLEWMRAGYRREKVSVALDVLQAVSGYGLAVAIVARHLATTGDLSQALLLCFWAIQLQILGQQLDIAGRQFPPIRSAARRLLEPLGAVEEGPALTSPTPPLPKGEEGKEKTLFGDAFLPSLPLGERGRGSEGPPGVALSFEKVCVVAAGHPILTDVDLEVAAGDHLAIVGPSGAGKTSLVGLLLGWHTPASGRILIDGETLTAERLAILRRETVWVDPEVQLWNAPLLANLLYGTLAKEALRAGAAIEAAELRSLLEELPQGLQTPLGEGGALVSGGEGQRVRLGRAFLRRHARLVILDEPFRGLDRCARRRLLARARGWWPGATLLCITHDLEPTLDFDRVAVVASGRLAELGRPGELAARSDSRYRQLLDQETAIRERLHHEAGWRRLRLTGGRLRDDAAGDGHEPSPPRPSSPQGRGGRAAT